MTHVTAAVIKNKHGQILICRRGAGGSCAYLWEFPGGKQEPGETLEECLLRECREELKIEISIKSLFDEMTYEYPDGKLAFYFYKAEIINGIPENRVHSDIKWVMPQELHNYDFCPADAAIIERLKYDN